MNLSLSSRARLRLARLFAIVTVAAGVVCTSGPASAQIYRVSGSTPALYPGGTMRGTDVAYDPANGVYLMVVAHGPVYGVFVNTNGTPVTGPFTIMDGGLGFGHFPRVEYSPHISNGVGGFGGFLVTWNHNVGRPNYVFGRLVSYASPSRVLNGIVQIADGAEGGVWHESGPAMAYSPTNQRFLVAWRTVGYGIRGRFVGVNGVPIGDPVQFENAGGARDPGLAWNPATNEFGLVYTAFNNSGAFTNFRRIRASDGFVSGRTTFGFAAGTFATGIDVNTWTGQYVMTWALHPGTMSATFDASGNLLGTNFITGRFGYDQSLGLSFNDATGTFLAVGSDSGTLEVAAAEIRGGGAPHTTAQVVTDGARLGSFYPMAGSRPGVNQWNVVYSRDFNGATGQLVGSSTTGGGGPSSYTGGGGGTTTPPPPSPSPTGCTTPDPFVSIGGGVCVNGGWVPKGTTTTPPPPSPVPPPPPPPSSTCSTPDPFVSIGGGVCINGGWVPAGAAPAPPPPPPAPSPTPVPSTCSTPDPFVSIGGGTCVNGGWIPGRSSGTTTGCTTPDPFVSLGGGVCENGGWKPKTIACIGPDPFVSIGGGVCIGTGWVPKGM